MKKIYCATFEGIEAKAVSVEATLTKGLPSFSIVGMANTAITESKERVKSALLDNGFTFPPKRITVNLSPSDLKKEGSHFDLGIALLIALNHCSLDLDNWFIFGELGLDGVVKENTQLFALVLSLANSQTLRKAIVPQESLAKITRIPGIDFFGVRTLKEAIALLTQENAPQPQHTGDVAADILYETRYPIDFSEVKGQNIAKQAALISAAGMHNLLLEGSPGCGKSMIINRLRYILPPLQRHELLEIAKLDALEGKEPQFKPLRPFRSPHHTATAASIFGGGSHKAQIGEVGLAHHGILFFDELPYFSKNVLEALREPLQEHTIRISRVHSKVEYPARFLFAAAMNPCPCGNLLNPALACRCGEREVQQYKNRLSEPFLDRIDLYVQMQQQITENSSDYTSTKMHQKVLDAYRMQHSRGQNHLNGQLNDQEIATFCHLEPPLQLLLEQARERFSLSMRSLNKIRKIARTIADLRSSSRIEKEDLLEALSYRQRS